MDIQIKRLSEKDWLAFAQIRLRGLQTDPQAFGSNYKTESEFTEEDWRSRLAAEDNAIFLLSENENPIGVTCVSVDRNDPTGKTAILWGSWLAPEFRGKNLSELMYRTRIDRAKSQPTVEKIIVSHRASNEASKRAIRKHGFVETYRIEKQWTDGVTEDDIFYELKIRP